MTGTERHLPRAVNPRRERGSRRRLPVLVTALAAVAACTAIIVGIGVALWLDADVNAVGDHRFQRKLRIPPLLEPRENRAGRKVFELGLRAGRTELLPGTRTATWGVNGPHLGPTLRAARGDTVQMRVSNGLPEATTLHWHGMHLPAAADGGPHQRIEPRATWSPSWTIDQPAATLWYHPHLTGRTADHVYRGLAGLFLIDDPQANGLALPSAYGVDDIPLIIQDKRLEDDGRLDFGQGVISPIGRLGDEILVNGTHSPYLDIRHRLVRLRLLNASTARIYNIGFADGRRFDLIATDGGLLESPEPMTRIQLSVGERAEILVAFEAGQRAVLRSFEPDLGTNPFEGRFSGADDTFDLLELRAAEQLVDAAARPRTLVRQPKAPDPDQPRRVRRFELGNRDINDLEMDMARIDQEVRVGDTEIWEIENTTGTPHNFHVHDVRFRVLRYAGGSPPPALSGLKDTVYIPPGETVRFVTTFEDYADPTTSYMFHCHILEHEDRGMMGQFVVTDGSGSLEHGSQADPVSP